MKFGGEFHGLLNLKFMKGMSSMKLRRFATYVACLAASMVAAPMTAKADTATHFSSNGLGGSLIDDTLNLLGIPDDASSETTVTQFVVPGSGPGSLTFQVLFDHGSFLYDFGFYDVSAVTADPVADSKGYAIQALSHSVEVFDDRLVDPGALKTVTVQGGAVLGFFIVPNNTIANVLADPDKFFPSSITNGFYRAPLFSVSDANPGQFDQFLSFLGGGKTLFTFEDLSRAPGSGSDSNFTDLGFSIDVQLGVAPVPEPAALTLGGVAGTIGLALAAARRGRPEGRAGRIVA